MQMHKRLHLNQRQDTKITVGRLYIEVVREDMKPFKHHKRQLICLLIALSECPIINLSKLKN